ncbi:MAG: hypothetical protein ACE14M_10195 [Terriglobales bacterium]
MSSSKSKGSSKDALSREEQEKLIAKYLETLLVGQKWTSTMEENTGLADAQPPVGSIAKQYETVRASTCVCGGGYEIIRQTLACDAQIGEHDCITAMCKGCGSERQFRFPLEPAPEDDPKQRPHPFQNLPLLEKRYEKLMRSFAIKDKAELDNALREFLAEARRSVE